MNARLYDPVVGRFLSPDPYVQNPNFAQSYNRYSYALNNPLKYTDPSGEKWWHWVLGAALLDPISAITTAFATASTFAGFAGATVGVTYGTAIANTPIAGVSGLIDGITSGDYSQVGKRIGNAWKIANGMFATDEDLSGGAQAWQIMSRQLWEQPYTNIGYLAGNVVNFLSRADVSHFHGATVVQTSMVKGNDGMTLGSNIFLSKENSVDYSNTTLLHEYGHYLQGRNWGGLPMTSMSVFSLFSTLKLRSTGTHHNTWSEMDASIRGLNYFRDRMSERQIEEFRDTFEEQKYYDRRFLRSYILPDILFYWLYDITWSK